MSTETTANPFADMPEVWENIIKYVEAFIRKHDRWMEIVAEALAGDKTRYNPRRMPSKKNKAWAYDEAGKITRALGLPRCNSVEDMRAAAAAGRAALAR